VLAVGVGVAALDEDAGLRQWLHLRSELADARERIAGLREGNRALEEQAAGLELGSFEMERAIREELELVRPGQTLVRLRRGDLPLSDPRDRRGLP